MRSLLFLFLLTATFCCFAHADNSPTWRHYTSGELWTDEDAVSPGRKITIGFYVKLENHWHAYWINPGDSGAPVKLNLKASSNSRRLDILAEPIQFPLPSRLDSGPITSFVYDAEVLFVADVIVPDSLQIGDHLDLQLDAEWLVCSDVCIPAFDHFEISLPIKKLGEAKPASHAEQFLSWRERLPRLMREKPEIKRDGETVDFVFKRPSDFAHFKFKDFFPLRGSQLSNQKVELVSDSPTETHVRTKLRAGGEARPDLIGLLVLTNGKSTIGLQWGDPSYGFLNKSLDSSVEKPVVQPTSIILILLSAFLGGLILNLMPCVFPVLSIKLLSLMQQSGESLSKIRSQNISYTAGVVLSFLAIGMALSILRSAGSFVGWGFQLQSGYFVLLLSWLFFLLALQLLGFFEFNLLNPNLGGNLTRGNGARAAFFTGVLAVVVASPCTAPFMGAALGFAIAQSMPVLLMVFVLMGFGLAFPYLLFAVFPSWSRVLPRPGAWMQKFKELMAFPLLLTAVWLVWLLAQLKGDMAVVLSLMGMIFWVFVIWLRARKILAAVMSVLLLLIALKLLDTLPNVSTRVTELSAGLNWEPFEESQAVWSGGPSVFADFTADWCLTCKVNERLVFDRAEVVKFLKDHGVRLLKGDWTRQDAAITQFLARHQRVGVPFYIAFGPGAPGGKILPEILTPEIFENEMKTVLQTKEGTK